MNGEMGPSQVFIIEVPLEVQVEEILEQRGLPTSAEEGATHYYADFKASTLQKQPYHVDVDGASLPQEGSALEDCKNYSQFLRLPQEPPRRSNIHHEPLVDYS